MTLLLLIGAGTLILVFGVFWLLQRRDAKRANERAEEYRKEAEARGWKLTWDRKDGAGSFHYVGTGDGVAWTFHTARHSARAGADALRQPSRWETTAVSLPAGALAIFPGSAEHRLRPDSPRFVTELALRPIVNALGGDAADAPVLASAIKPLAGPSGFTCRATEMQRMAGWLISGAAEAISSIRIPDLVAIVLWHRGLQIAVARPTNDPERIARISELGIRLVKAAELAAEGPRPWEPVPRQPRDA